jgi:AraC-like DNA-binding protein
MSHLIQNYSDGLPVGRSRGGLASWQERIAKEILFARMRNPPTIDELSQACGVSGRHFIRAFRQSTGRTPHQWLMQERALSARNLLEHSSRTLGGVRLRQSEPPLPRFPEILWSAPVHGKAAGECERCEALTERQAGRADGTCDFSIDFLKPHYPLIDSGLRAARSRIAV